MNLEPTAKPIDTWDKALQVNLDRRWYGTFAEIGGGQEVSRWFFRVGGASGTVAKSMSAYDMAVSDAVYGKTDRYVSRARLQAMLDREFQLDLERLSVDRGDTTRFFAFADTVATRNFKGTNESHGWLGVKFQAHPRDEASQILVHVRLLDPDAVSQQEALGIVGVNLLHGAFFIHHEPERLVESLRDNVISSRVEIDMIEFSGIEFRYVDNRIMALKLVQLGLTGAAMFGPKGEVLQPSEILHKKPILVERGSFRPVTHVNVDMVRCAREKFITDPAVADKQVVELMELTMRNLLAEKTEVDRRDFLARADLMCACGFTVMISDYFRFYRLATYLQTFTNERVGFVMGLPSLADLFNEKYYVDLPGGILESFGRLFKNDLKLFVYPLRKHQSDQLETISTLEVSGPLSKLYQYLADRGSFVHLDNFNPEYLHIFSRDVLERIAAGDPAWEKMVPVAVAENIKRRGFFGFRPELEK
jgi:hypothetical protein